MTKADLCVVFDLDDTLYLERDYVRSGFQHVGRYAQEELHISDFDARAWALFLAGRRGDIFNEILQQENIPSTPAVLNHLVALYRSHVPKISLQEDARLCLTALDGQVQMALISDGPVDSQKNKVAALGLDRWFAPVLLTEELGVGYGKPNSRAFRLVQDEFGFKPDHFYYVADNPLKDFIAPRELGWHTVRIRRKDGIYSAIESTADQMPELELAGLSGLVNLLQRTWTSLFKTNEVHAAKGTH